MEPPLHLDHHIPLVVVVGVVMVVPLNQWVKVVMVGRLVVVGEVEVLIPEEQHLVLLVEQQIQTHLLLDLETLVALILVVQRLLMVHLVVVVQAVLEQAEHYQVVEVTVEQVFNYLQHSEIHYQQLVPLVQVVVDIGLRVEVVEETIHKLMAVELLVKEEDLVVLMLVPEMQLHHHQLDLDHIVQLQTILAIPHFKTLVLVVEEDLAEKFHT